MLIKRNAELDRLALPKLVHRTLAGPWDGMTQAEVWLQLIEPGGETPVHKHACEEVVVVLEGRGSITIDGVETVFEADSTVIVPKNVIHKISNVGDTPMRLIGILAEAPVHVLHPDGTRMHLPWDQDRREGDAAGPAGDRARS